MRNIFILAATHEGAETPAASRGDLFDFALGEIVRVLDMRARGTNVLVPWSADLAPLVAAAIADTAPSFDPEGSTGDETQSVLVPYYAPGARSLEESSHFWHATHMSLRRETPLSLTDALRQYPPADVVVLSASKDFGALRNLLQSGAVRILAFASLTPIAEVAALLDISSDRIVNLEQRLDLTSERADTERMPELKTDLDAEMELEPHVAFGLLVQSYFEEIIPDDDERSRRRLEK